MDRDELHKFLNWLYAYPFDYTPSEFDLVIDDYLSGKPYSELEPE